MVKPLTMVYTSWLFIHDEESTKTPEKQNKQEFEEQEEMGLSNFPIAAEGVLPIIVMNTVLSVAILKSLLKSVLEIMGAAVAVSSSLNTEEDPPEGSGSGRRKRRISITQFKSLCEGQASEIAVSLKGVECSVCLNRFEEEEEVSELSCKHFFHRRCLEKWFDNHHSTCPLCRSAN